MSECRSFADRDQLDQALADHIAARLRSDIEARGSASLAVSGGGTPRLMFRRLAQCELAWSRVWVTLVDERWVDPDSEESNERLVRENLLQERAAQASFVGLKGDSADAGDSVQVIASDLAAIPLPFSMVVLGMGNDGHTASWFPQADNLPALLDPDGQATVAATHPVTAPHQRITLTMPAVLNSAEIALYITGEEKRGILASAAQHHHPVAAVLAQTRTPVITWWAP